MNDSGDSQANGAPDGCVSIAEADELIEANRLIEAKEICDRRVAANRDDADALYALGWIALRQQDIGRAMSHFRRVIELKPDHARAHYNLGTVLMRRGEMAAAGGHFEAAVTAEPDFAQALCDLGSLRLAEGDLNAAGIACEKAMALAPHDPDVLHNLGQVLFRRHACKDAEGIMRKALRLRPNNIEFMGLLADILQRRGAFKSAEALLQKATSRSPNNHRLLVDIGALYMATQRREKALEAYIQAFKLDPASVGALARLSQFTANEWGLDLCAAIDKANKAIGPNDAYSSLTLGFAKARALDAAKDYEKAWLQARKANADFRRHYEIDTTGGTSFVKEPAPGLRDAFSEHNDGRTPIADQTQFIIIAGMPRSGKSTIESLLGDVPGVNNGYENDIIREIIDDFNRQFSLEAYQKGDISRRHLSSGVQRIFEQKLADRSVNCKAYTVTVHATHVINTIPHLVTIMPNVSFIFVDRDIWDNAARIYLYKYPPGELKYSYRFSSIVQQIRRWRSAMNWWLNAEPERCLKVSYEDLAADSHSVLSKICRFCNLDIPSAPFSPVFDDRGCAVPYRQMMDQELAGESGVFGGDL